MLTKLAMTRPDCRRCLANHVSFCSQLDAREINELNAMSSGMRFQAGTVIVGQEDAYERLYIINEGLVRLVHLAADGDRQITGFLGPGDLLGGIKRQAGAFSSAEAISNVEACAFDHKEFVRFLEFHPRLCLKLLVVATDEIEAQYDHAILLARKQASERLAAFILMVAHRWHLSDDLPNVVQLPMSRSDIADHVGLTIETISRVFSSFKRRGLVEFETSKRLILKNIPALVHLAQLDDMPTYRMSMGL